MFFEEVLPLSLKGATVAIGTGRTVTEFLSLLPEEFFEHNNFMSTSLDTERTLGDRGVKSITISSVDAVDLYIDGADFVSRNQPRAIKGYGGALYKEKLCFLLAKKRVIIVKSPKIRDDISGFYVPFEVLPNSGRLFERELIDRGLSYQLRICAGGKFGAVVTENGGILYDILIEGLDESVVNALSIIPGVICHGFFFERDFSTVILDEQKILKY